MLPDPNELGQSGEESIEQLRAKLHIDTAGGVREHIGAQHRDEALKYRDSHEAEDEDMAFAGQRRRHILGSGVAHFHIGDGLYNVAMSGDITQLEAVDLGLELGLALEGLAMPAPPIGGLPPGLELLLQAWADRAGTLRDRRRGADGSGGRLGSSGRGAALGEIR